MSSDNYENGVSGTTMAQNVDPASKPYSWFRSEPMSLCQLYLQTESAYSIVSILGELGICQFGDLNEGKNAFQRKFINELRRCVQMETKLGFFQKEIELDKIPIVDCQEEPTAPSIKDIINLESQLEKLERNLIEANKNRINLKSRFLELTELCSILRHADTFYAEVQSHNDDDAEGNRKKIHRKSVIDHDFTQASQDVNIPLASVVDIFTLTGTILLSRFNTFERMLWRFSHGNILIKKFDIEEELEHPETGEMQSKCLFILFGQGDRLQQTCKKICDGFKTNLYSCPEKAEERLKIYGGVLEQMNELMMVIQQSNAHRNNILSAAARNLKRWKVLVVKMKSIYEVLNCFQITDHSLIGECWIPAMRIADARHALVLGQNLSNSAVASVLNTLATNETPPTYNVTNKFTCGFQAIIDSYGVANYGEVNPAPYSIITFPFIFAVMFGDCGHGIIMAIFAIWMCLKEKQLASIKDEIFSMFYSGRYIILLMGLFSIYTGFIYNDIFAKAMNLFGSEFVQKKLEFCNVTDSVGNKTMVACFHHEHYTLDPQANTHPEYIYPFGIDPVWQLSENKVVYLNTYKMKISVILGVIQMLFGVFLSIFNHLHFGHYISVFFEFIPQVIFLLAIFGYMNFMIIYKWFMYNSTNSHCAPSILITLINMFMFKQPSEEDPCYLKDPMYENQNLVQSALIIAALVCIPIMLLVKPIYDHCCKSKSNEKWVLSSYSNPTDDLEMQIQADKNVHQNGVKRGSVSTEESVNLLQNHKEATESSDPHASDNFGDAFINQAIHTIEYCLGSVSHTASYLRLWALSLAHTQLSEVLWNMVMVHGFMEFHLPIGPPEITKFASALLMTVIFAAWAILTVSILIVMEGLSAFLHALRLHWVEFMSKFYSGSGIAFTPFSFRTIIDQLS